MNIPEKIPAAMLEEPKPDLPSSQEKSKSKDPDVSAYERMRLGVYEVIFAEKETPYSLSLEPLVAPYVQRFYNVRAALPYCIRFLNDLYSVAPFVLVLLGVMEVIASVLPTLSLYFDNALFSSVRPPSVFTNP